MTTDDLTSRGWRVAAFSHSNGCSCAQTHWLHSLPFTAAAAAKSLQLCPTLCDPIDGSPPGSPIPGILQARTLEQVAISFSNAWKWKVKVTQSCPTLCDPMDYTVHGILQARILEWVAIPFFKGLPNPGIKPVSPVLQVNSLPAELPGKPFI